MVRGPGQGLRKALGERFASTWVLLSDTTNFLSRTDDFLAYQGELMELRLRLQSNRGSPEIERRIRDQVVDLRKSLRLQGFDLALGDVDLVVAGFRTDAAVAEGFKRIVLSIGTRSIRWLSGEANHVELDRNLDSILDREGRREREERVRHFLWYRRDPRALVFSGSDSEDAASFEGLRAWAAGKDNALRLLGALKSLR